MSYLMIILKTKIIKYLILSIERRNYYYLYKNIYKLSHYVFLLILNYKSFFYYEIFRMCVMDLTY